MDEMIMVLDHHIPKKCQGKQCVMNMLLLGQANKRNSSKLRIEVTKCPIKHIPNTAKQTYSQHNRSITKLYCAHHECVVLHCVFERKKEEGIIII